MPIIQIRPEKESPWLIATYPPRPKGVNVLRAWLEAGRNAELIIYPGNYIGNVSPVAWRAASSFLLRVAEDGEQAEILATGVLPGQKTLADVMTEWRTTGSDEIQGVGPLTTIGSENKTALISMALEENRIAIGGVMLHTNPEELDVLRTVFPETPLAMPGDNQQ